MSCTGSINHSNALSTSLSSSPAEPALPQTLPQTIPDSTDTNNSAHEASLNSSLYAVSSTSYTPETGTSEVFYDTPSYADERWRDIFRGMNIPADGLDVDLVDLAESWKIRDAILNDKEFFPEREVHLKPMKSKPAIRELWHRRTEKGLLGLCCENDGCVNSGTRERTSIKRCSRVGPKIYARDQT